MKQINSYPLLVIMVVVFSSFSIKYDDGKTYKTAIKIDCACKEYTILSRFGFKPIKQALQISNNKLYDVFMNAKNELMIFEIIKKEPEQKSDTLKINYNEITI